MRSPSGFTFETDLDGKVHAGETYQCKHCDRHTQIKPFQRPEDLGGMCPRCTGLMCQRCTGLAAKGAACIPSEARHQEEIERAIERQRSLQSYGLVSS